MGDTYIDSDGQVLNIEHSYLAIRYFNNLGQLHRLDGPAILWKDASYYWVKNGEYHRIGGPTIFDKDDNRYEWYVNEKHISIYYIYG